jgi:hypothetical protein
MPPRATTRSPSAKSLTALTLLLLLGLAPAAPAFDLLGPLYEEGERVEVTGLVTTPDGEPIEDVQVTLELSRKAFDFRKLRRTRGKVFKVSDRTDASGEYKIAFPWDDYYNRFELVAGITVRGADGEELLELERLDVKDRIERSSPAVAPIVIENHELIETFRAFIATVDSDDERRVYRDQGRPDRVKTTRFDDREETSWWYFDRGKVYRFEDGELAKVEDFDPVEEL